MQNVFNFHYNEPENHLHQVGSIDWSVALVSRSVVLYLSTKFFFKLRTFLSTRRLKERFGRGALSSESYAIIAG